MDKSSSSQPPSSLNPHALLKNPLKKIVTEVRKSELDDEDNNEKKKLYPTKKEKEKT
jgi:hypothetical protein